MVYLLRPWRLVSVALLALLLLGLTPLAQAQGSSRLVWATVAGPGANIVFTDVFMTSPERAWAVGWQRDPVVGVVYQLRLENGRWQAYRQAELAYPLYGVAATSDTNVWVVGDSGLIVRHDGSSWSVSTNPLPNTSLRDIQLLGDGSQAWAVGTRSQDGQTEAVALRYSNGRWEQATVEGAENQSLDAIHLNNGGAWAVGSEIWRLDGGTWRREASPDFCGGAGCMRGYSAVRAIDGERAIAVGTRHGGCAICASKLAVGVRGSGGWTDAEAGNLLPVVTPNYDAHGLSGIYLTDANNGLAVGRRNYADANGNYTADIFGLRYSSGSWSYEAIALRNAASPLAVYMADPTRALVVGTDGLILSYGYGSQQAPVDNPTRPVTDPKQPGVAFFAATGHTLRGAFRSYWERNGGLEQFGYPLTEEFSESGFVVQYFERARFEYHPENAGTQYEVLLGLLGNTITTNRRSEPPFNAVSPNGQPGSIYFPETSHNMAPEFVAYWKRYGGLPVYGYPISEPFYEINPADGRSYLVQYFERNRFEYHPENAGTRYEVLLGLLGREILQGRGWL